MAYQCRDCSFTGRKFPQGLCPACGSAHVTRPEDPATTDAKKRNPWSLVILAILWAYLGWAIYQKLLP